jgi:fumarate reductase flavoprotein subunit
LAEGLVEVVPTAHYMMGGVVFRADCSTELDGLFAAGEDTGGVHGANRLGGNGVANSTVFGGIAGDSIATWVPEFGELRDPDEAAIEAAVEACRAPLGRPPGDVETYRERLHDVMWEDAGIIRDAASLDRADAALDEIDAGLDGVGVAGDDLAFNLTWHDWMNLKNLVLVSRAITAAARARTDSRGAHYREDFPDTADLDTSAFTRVRYGDDGMAVDTEPVSFTRVRPGESLLDENAAQ